jgi:hypothetical protein
MLATWVASNECPVWWHMFRFVSKAFTTNPRNRTTPTNAGAKWLAAGIRICRERKSEGSTAAALDGAIRTQPHDAISSQHDKLSAARRPADTELAKADVGLLDAGSWFGSSR